jgi:membrane peptidoglycan carboxypeptidase
VWVGNDDGKPMDRVTGGGLPATLWRAFMRAAKNQP